MARYELLPAVLRQTNSAPRAIPDTSAPDRGLKQSAYYCRFAGKLSNSGGKRSDRITGLQD